jgi:hypothetical protein
VIFTNKSDVAQAKEIQGDKRCIALRKEDYLPYDFSKELKRRFFSKGTFN